MIISKNNKILALFTFTMLAFSDTGIQNTTIANWVESTAAGSQTQHDQTADSLLVAQTLVNQLTGNINSIAPRDTNTTQAALNTAFQLLLEEFKTLNTTAVDNTTIFNSLLSGLPNLSTDAKNKAMVSAGLSSSNNSYNNNASSLENFDLLNNSELNDATFSQLSGIGKGDLATINGLISQATLAYTSGFSSFGIGSFGGLADDPSATRISEVDQGITIGTSDAIWEKAYLRVLKYIIQYGDLAQHGSSIKLTAIANLLAQAVGTKATDLTKVQTIIAGLQAQNNGVRMYSSKEIMNTLTGINIQTTTNIANFILNHTSLLGDLDVGVRLRLGKLSDTSKSTAGQIADTIDLLSSIISPANRYDMDYIVKEILSTYSITPSAEIIHIITNQILSNSYFFENPSDQNGNSILIQKALYNNGMPASILLSLVIDPSKSIPDQITDMITFLSKIISTEQRYDINYVVTQILTALSSAQNTDILKAIMYGLLANTYFFQNPSDKNGNLGLEAKILKTNGVSLQDALNYIIPFINSTTEGYNYFKPNAVSVLPGILQTAGYSGQEIINWINSWGNSTAEGSWGSLYTMSNTNYVVESITTSGNTVSTTIRYGFPDILTNAGVIQSGGYKYITDTVSFSA